jgi:hypothetical protein
MTNETIGMLADLAIALSFIAALIFGVVQVQTASRDRRERLTLETLRQFQTREFAGLMLFINSQTFPLTRKELQSRSADEQAIYM